MNSCAAFFLLLLLNNYFLSGFSLRCGELYEIQARDQFGRRLGNGLLTGNKVYLLLSDHFS